MLEPAGEEWLEPAQIAKRFGVGRSTIDLWCKNGMPFEWRDRTHGRTKVQRASEIEAWLQKTGRLAKLKLRAKASQAEAPVVTAVAATVPDGGLFRKRDETPGPPKIEEVRNLFRAILTRCDDFQSTTLDILELNHLTSAMKRLASEARLLEEHANEQRRESGEWIEAARAKKAVVDLSALFVTDLEALVADVVNEGAVNLDAFVVAGKLDDVRRVLAVVMRGAVDALRARTAEAAAGAEL